MQKWLQRTSLLLGEEKVKKFNEMHVLVVGIGGVGGYAAEMLCRAGIGNITIIDGDIVNETNLNRQLIATTKTIGQPKTSILKKRLVEINPQLNLTAVQQFLSEEQIESILLKKRYDYVVDAIDTIAPKLFLLTSALKHGIPVISSMGAGAKSDPSKINIADISKTYNCTLAKTIRKRLRKMGIKKGIKTVFSTELPETSSVLLVEGERNKKSVVGTISYLPAMFGCFLAAEVLKDLVKPTDQHIIH